MGAKPKIFCCVTLDVEVDKDPFYRISSPPRFRNVTEAIPELLEPLFLEFGVRPTYLLSSEVIQDPDSVSILRRLRTDHELGTHGHGELLGPEINIRDFQGKPLHDFICDYPPDVQKEKLTWLTELFYETFGYKPLSFRGGRFGISGQTAKILQDLGYKVDSSVTPGLFWENNSQIVSFIHAPEQPYHPDEKDITRHGKLKILEIPVSSWEAWPLGKKVREWLACHPRFNRFFPEIGKKLLLKVTSRIRWLRPTSFSGETLKKWTKNFIKRNLYKKFIVINIMFHPFELVIGASPYSITPNNTYTIYANLRSILNFFFHHNVLFRKLSDIPLEVKKYI